MYFYIRTRFVGNSFPDRHADLICSPIQEEQQAVKMVST